MSESVVNGRPGQPGKESFDDIYDRPDPRPYFRTLHPLEYQPPRHAQKVFRAAVAALREGRGRDEPVGVVDLCCSYGINPALLNHDLTLDDLYTRYAATEAGDVSAAELARRDRAFFAARRARRARCVGVDAAANAVGYAVRVGLLDEGHVEDLETNEPSAELCRDAASADLVTVTGGIGYITTRTIDRVVGCASEPPWVAAFVLRMIPYEPIAEALSRRGLMTEKYSGGTFVQRRFASVREQEYALEELARAGVDAKGKEAEGYYHSDLYVSRPPRDAAELPLERLLEGGR